MIGNQVMKSLTPDVLSDVVLGNTTNHFYIEDPGSYLCEIDLETPHVGSVDLKLFERFLMILCDSKLLVTGYTNSGGDKWVVL